MHCCWSSLSTLSLAFSYKMVMQQCWLSDPDQRPKFSQLRAEIDGILTAMAGYLDFSAIALCIDMGKEDVCFVMLLLHDSSECICLHKSIQSWHYSIPFVTRILAQQGIQRIHKTRFSLWRSLLMIWVGVAVPLHQRGKPPSLLGSVSSWVERAAAALTHSSHEQIYFWTQKVVVLLMFNF